MKKKVTSKTPNERAKYIRWIVPNRVPYRDGGFDSWMARGALGRGK